MKRIIFFALFFSLLGSSTFSQEKKPGTINTVTNASGKTEYVTVKTADGYLVKEASGKLVYRVVENDREKRVYDNTGRLVSRTAK